MSNTFYIHLSSIPDFLSIALNIRRVKVVLYVVCPAYFKADNEENDEHDIATGMLNGVSMRIRKNNICGPVSEEVVILNKEIFRQRKFHLRQSPCSHV